MGGYPPPPGSSHPPPPGGYPPPGGPTDAPQPGGWSPPPPGGGPAAPPPPPGPFASPAGRPGDGYGYSGYGAAHAKAGFWARFAAFIIDSIVVGLFGIPAYIALVTGPTRVEACSLDSSGEIDFDGTVKNGLCEVPTSTTWAIVAVLSIAALVGALFYFAKTEGRTGQTLGALALGIKVVDTGTGQPIGGGRAIGRYFARILSAIPCYLGYLWMLWDPDKQTWHDKIVNAYVVKT